MLLPFRVSPTAKLIQFFGRFAVWSMMVGCGGSFVRGELLIEHERGGLDRYTATYGPVAAGFTFSEPTRIEGVTAWMSAGDPVAVSIGLESPDQAIFSKDFAGTFIPGLPGKWQGVGGLKWDLPAGDYFVQFSRGFFPIGYGGPVSTAPQGFQSFKTYSDYGYGNPSTGWSDIGFPLGMRVYGSPLSAVPEPTTYGAWAGFVLVGMALVRRRWVRISV